MSEIKYRYGWLFIGLTTLSTILILSAYYREVLRYWTDDPLVISFNTETTSWYSTQCLLKLQWLLSTIVGSESSLITVIVLLIILLNILINIIFIIGMYWNPKFWFLGIVGILVVILIYWLGLLGHVVSVIAYADVGYWHEVEMFSFLRVPPEHEYIQYFILENGLHQLEYPSAVFEEYVGWLEETRDGRAFVKEQLYDKQLSYFEGNKILALQFEKHVNTNKFVEDNIKAPFNGMLAAKLNIESHKYVYLTHGLYLTIIISCILIQYFFLTPYFETLANPPALNPIFPLDTLRESSL